MNNLETKAKEMFSKLKEHMGEEVLMEYWTYGVYCAEYGTLSKLIDFERVQVGCVNTPFIGYGAAVISIFSKDGDILYLQPLGKPYNERDPFKINEIIRGIFGDEIAKQAWERHQKVAKDMEERQRRAKETHEEFKATGAKEIIEKTSPYVVDELKEEFAKMVNNSGWDTYYIYVIKIVSDLLIAIGNGMNFEEAINTVKEKHGSIEDEIEKAVDTIANYSIRGKEFRKYWNGLYGVSDDTEGAANPAILVLSRKE